MITRLYAVLTTENGEETIAAASFDNALNMQAVTSKFNLAEDMYKFFKIKFPGQEFKIVSFAREENL